LDIEKNSKNGGCFELEIIFGASSSPYYRKAVRLAKKIEAYSEENIIELLHVVRIYDLKEFEKHQNNVKNLVLLISKWNSFEMTLNGEIIGTNTLRNIYNEINIKNLRY
jgi:hypothetical protein